MSAYRKLIDCFKESDTVRPSHLLVNDLKQERTDWKQIAGFKMAVYMFFNENYNHLRGKAEDGNFGFKIEYVPATCTCTFPTREKDMCLGCDEKLSPEYSE
jgi:hypothetical protein